MEEVPGGDGAVTIGHLEEILGKYPDRTLNLSVRVMGLGRVEFAIRKARIDNDQITFWAEVCGLGAPWRKEPE
jgi:hypothetical protein